MGKVTGFKEFERQLPKRRPVTDRVQDWQEVYDENSFSDDQLKDQGARCMDCGIPFCHNGCPLGNIIPDWNDLVYRGRWREALEMLFKTNNFPEFTGRVCPAPCEEACTLNIYQVPVTIKNIELNIIEHAFREGWIKPQPPVDRTGKKVAVIGSGPAGLAAAAQLNKAGHLVTVFERADRIGGLLTYGIPEFKLEKHIVSRRLRLMEAEGIIFVTNANVGNNTDVENLRREFDALVFACGSTLGRDLNVPGRELKGIHFAMEYLPQQNQKNLGDSVPDQITAVGKHVIILGGGDTGADCLGTALRQKAKSVHQFELLPKPPLSRTVDMPWPNWPMILRSSSAHEEGGIRDWAINTKSFSGMNGNVSTLHAIRVEWVKGESHKYEMREIPGSEFEIPCDLCLLAMGFVHPEHEGPIQKLGLQLDPRGNVKTDNHYMTNLPGVFACGDMRRGQSLVVWAITEGRQAAKSVDCFLSGSSDL